MKYKRLTIEELKELEKEFVNYLAAAQITAEDWAKMKVDENEKAEKLIDVFCDMVYEKALNRINFLEHRDKKTLNLFYCLDYKIELIGVRAKELSNIDFTDEKMFHNWTDDHTINVDIVKSEKKYTKERNIEIFELLEAGCLITNEKLFKLLKSLIK